MRFIRLLVTILILILPTQVFAAPYFYFSGASSGNVDSTYTLSIYAVSDGSTLTAAQTEVEFDNSYLTAKSISILSSACSFWAPADPSLGYGNTPSPYFYPTSSSDRVVLSCGFSNPGYTSSDSNGDLIAKIRFTPSQTGSTTLDFDAANTLFRYIGTTIAPGTLSDFDVTVLEASATAAPGATATPTPTASSSSDSSSDESSSGDVTTITEDDLTFVEIGVNSGTGTTTDSDDVVLQVVDEDNIIPNPPALTPRAPATPFVFSLLSGGSSSAQTQDSGEVLAAQSLRELLIPGKSKADKTVVMVNLISTITFLVLLAVVIWRLVTITRNNRLKSKHMKDLLAGELAVFESKLGNSNSDTAQQIRDEIDEAVKRLNKEG